MRTRLGAPNAAAAATALSVYTEFVASLRNDVAASVVRTKRLMDRI